MDVRCERCRAQYVFDDEQVTPAGLTVQCTNCGHVFRVKKKELVVTVPVKPDELSEQPMPATAAAPRPHAEERPRERAVRQRGGGLLTFQEHGTLQTWIVERKVTRDDELSTGDGGWVRLGTRPELAPFFAVVDAADRSRAAPSAAPRGPGGTALYPPPRFPPPDFPPPPFPPFPPPGPPPSLRPPPAPAPPPAAEERSVTVELDEATMRAVKGRSGGAWVAVVLLVVAAGAAASVFAPALLDRPATGPTAPVAEPPAPPAATNASPAPPAPGAPGTGPAAAPAEPVAVPITIEMRAPAAPVGAPPPALEPPEPAPLPAPQPVADAAAPSAPEPVAAPRAPPRPKTTKQLLADARKLLEKGQAGKALDLYGKVLVAEPENAAALTGRGLCYLDLGQYHPAEASLKGALAVEPDQPDAIMGLAETYRTQGRKAEAVEQFERYLAAHPQGEEAAAARNALSQLKE